MKPCGLPILFEDRYLIAVNKPAGLLSVPIKGSAVVSALALVNEYLEQRKERALPVHRIDRYTSGIVVFAKGKKNHALLKNQFRRRAPVRRYLALIQGRIRPPKGELRHYLKLSAGGFKQLLAKGPERGAALAELRYEAKQFFRRATLVEVSLCSGLKNQIRVQFAAAGHPLVGERQYAAPCGAENVRLGLDRQALQAAYVEFMHPLTKRPVQINAPLDREMREALERIAHEIGDH